MLKNIKVGKQNQLENREGKRGEGNKDGRREGVREGCRQEEREEVERERDVEKGGGVGQPDPTETKLLASKNTRPGAS